MATGINDFLNKKYKELDFDGEFLASFGKPEKNFKCCVAGASGNKMLNNITTTLPYNKLIQNEKRTEFNPATDFANAYKWLEAKQGTIEFPNENARRDF
jgi:hypothetical protein